VSRSRGYRNCRGSVSNSNIVIGEVGLLQLPRSNWLLVRHHNQAMHLLIADFLRLPIYPLGFLYLQHLPPDKRPLECMQHGGDVVGSVYCVMCTVYCVVCGVLVVYS
jgi:hypothetical protein